MNQSSKPTSPSALARTNRRRFLRRSSLVVGAALGLPAWFSGGATRTASGEGRRRQGPNEKLNIAIIGVGGLGGANLGGVQGENIVALCDVYETPVLKAAQQYPQAKKYRDFRRLFDDAKDFDAVVVSTCEHTHAFAVLPALQLGKHVYCEKPLTHDVWEAHVLIEATRRAKVATQMGTQIHAGDNYRRVVELVQTGVIGPVRESSGQRRLSRRHEVGVGPRETEGEELPGGGATHSPTVSPRVETRLRQSIWLAETPSGSESVGGRDHGPFRSRR